MTLIESIRDNFMHAMFTSINTADVSIWMKLNYSTVFRLLTATVATCDIHPRLTAT